jgi:hypothetical protein
MRDTAIETFLAAQPDSFEIVWYVDDMDDENGWSGGWVDVHCDAIEDALGYAWIWMITSPCDDTAGDIVWPPDRTCIRLVDPQNHEFWWETAVPVGAEPTPEQAGAMHEAASGTSGAAYWFGAPGWTAEAIQAALQDWTLRHLDRLFPMRWDRQHGLSRFLRHAIDSMERIKSGEEQTYLLKPGEGLGGSGATVMASEQVMDMLLSWMVDEDD